MWRDKSLEDTQIDIVIITLTYYTLGEAEAPLSLG